MPRQTSDISTTQGQLWKCDNCNYQERRPVIAGSAGTQDDSARVAGYRTAPDGKVYCPECTGIDEGYWDRRTLAAAYAAGIDAGNPAWGGGL